MRIIILSFILLFSAVGTTYSQDVSIVITQGIGKDVESATQRAAEAALIQVVGSFVDTNKLIEKRKEIRNGIRTQTKSISSKLSEYSQGSIKNLDVLEVAQEDGLTRVTAKITVRIEDFKRYIKATVLAEQKIQKGLLAQFKTDKKQENNLSNLLMDKVLRPILEYKVVVPKLGNISKVTNASLISLFKPLDNEALISFDVTVELDPNYLKSALRVLQEIAEKKYSCRAFINSVTGRVYPQHSAFIGFGVIEGPNRKSVGRITPGCASVVGFAAAGAFVRQDGGGMHKLPTIYGFPTNLSHLCDKLFKKVKAFYRDNDWKTPETLPPSHPSVNFLKSKLRFEFLSIRGDVIKEEIFDRYKRIGNHKKLISDSSAIIRVIGKDKFTHFDKHGSESALLSWAPVGGFTKACSFFIKKSAAFRIISKVTEEVLGRADKVVLSYIN